MTITDDATQQWSELTTHMEALLSAWETQSAPPTLREFLPKGNLALQVVAVVELIKIDLEQRHSRGLWHPLEWYAEKFPEMLHAGEPPCERFLSLVKVDIESCGGDGAEPETRIVAIGRGRRGHRKQLQDDQQQCQPRRAARQQGSLTVPPHASDPRAGSTRRVASAG